MKLTKAATRPVVLIELVSGWILLLVLGIAVPQAYEVATIGAITVFFGGRELTHRLGERA